MSTSFNPVVGQIIQSALRKIGTIDEDGTPTDAQYEDGIFMLNGMIKAWAASGIHVWTEQESILFMQPAQVEYQIGDSSPDHVAAWDDTTVTYLYSSALAGATTITVVDASEIVNGEKIGVVLDDYTTQWTTVNGAPVGNVITLTAALTGDTSANNPVFAYNTDLVRPMRVPAARRIAWDGLIETPITRMSRSTYMDLPNKYNLGTPNQYFYAPMLDKGLFYLWNAQVNNVYGIRFTAHAELLDVNYTNDTTDFPQEWIPALYWNLAQEMALDVGVSAPRWQIIQAQAAKWLDLAQSWDREPEPIYFGYSREQQER